MNVKTKPVSNGKGKVHLVFDFGDGDRSETSLCGRVVRSVYGYEITHETDETDMCLDCARAVKSHQLPASYVGELAAALYPDIGGIEYTVRQVVIEYLDADRWFKETQDLVKEIRQLRKQLDERGA